MSIFGNILSKIFGHNEAAASATPAPAIAPAPAAAAAIVAHPAAAEAPAPGSALPHPPEPVDVEAVLTQIAAAKGRPSNWRESIVDLLALLDLDSSLAARKELAVELNVHAGADGSAEQNIALHKAVMGKLVENGGRVPASLQG